MARVTLEQIARSARRAASRCTTRAPRDRAPRGARYGRCAPSADARASWAARCSCSRARIRSRRDGRPDGRGGRSTRQAAERGRSRVVRRRLRDRLVRRSDRRPRSAGGDQVWPRIAPPALGVGRERIDNARDIHRVVMQRYVREPQPRVPHDDPPQWGLAGTRSDPNRDLPEAGTCRRPLSNAWPSGPASPPAPRARRGMRPPSTDRARHPPQPAAGRLGLRRRRPRAARRPRPRRRPPTSAVDPLERQPIARGVNGEARRCLVLQRLLRRVGLDAVLALRRCLVVEGPRRASIAASAWLRCASNASFSGESAESGRVVRIDQSCDGGLFGMITVRRARVCRRHWRALRYDGDAPRHPDGWPGRGELRRPARRWRGGNAVASRSSRSRRRPRRREPGTTIELTLDEEPQDVHEVLSVGDYTEGLMSTAILQPTTNSAESTQIVGNSRRVRAR